MEWLVPLAFPFCIDLIDEFGIITVHLIGTDADDWALK